MLATGIKSPVGVKVAGTDLVTIDRITGEIERALKEMDRLWAQREYLIPADHDTRQAARS